MATKFQYYNSGDDGEGVIWGDKIVGQQFTVSIAHSIEYVKLKMAKYGSSSPGNLVVEIQEVGGDGKPTGVVLCSAIVDANAYNQPQAWRTINFSSPADLQPGMYAICCHDEDWDGSSTILVQWAKDGSSPTYSAGTMLYSGTKGATWQLNTGEDMMFEEWGTEIIVSSGINIPLETWGW